MRNLRIGDRVEVAVRPNAADPCRPFWGKRGTIVQKNIHDEFYVKLDGDERGGYFEAEELTPLNDLDALIEALND